MTRLALCALTILAGTGPGSILRAHEIVPRPEDEAVKPLARYTPTVKLIEQCIPSVGSIQTLSESGTPGVFNMAVGSASVIHERGFLLTNEHVVNRMAQGQVHLPGRGPLQFRTIAKMSSEDMALIKVEAGESLKPLRLGRSHDLMLGEPVLVIGNPGGLAHSVSTGIVSGLNRSTSIAESFLPWMIQTSAAVSGGNSGGPLINAVGEQIGIVTSKKLDGENINFAIAADRVREIFPVLLSAELRYGFRLGLEVDMYEKEALVKAVRGDTPAARAGIVPGDVIQSIGELTIRDGFDFHLALLERKPGTVLKMGLARESKTIAAEVELAELKLAEPVPEEGLEAGILFEGFEGRWDRLPDFDALKPAKSGRAETPTEEAFTSGNRENYALRFKGFLKIPREGLYTFYTSSDDGSRLKIGQEVVVDNDGLHGVLRVGGLTRLKQGLHPVEVTFFEQGGAEKLEVTWEGPELDRQVVPKEAWFGKK